MSRLGFVLAACAGATLLTATDARALGPVDIEAGAKVGGGVPLNNSTSPYAIPAMGFGSGGRAGVSLFNVYAGFSGVYYFGDTKTVTQEETTVKGSAHTLMLGAELGYDIKLFGLLTLRPQIGLGNNEIYRDSERGLPRPSPRDLDEQRLLLLRARAGRPGVPQVPVRRGGRRRAHAPGGAGAQSVPGGADLPFVSCRVYGARAGGRAVLR